MSFEKESLGVIKMNELQEIEFDILKECIRIIEKHDLKYFLVCGSALGAVKYGGFIPWDDDIDIALPRDDYNKFLEYALSELPENLFVQNGQTDQFYPLFGTKVRNRNTTYIESGKYQNIYMNLGVFIDVFPLDGYPSDPVALKRYEKKIKHWNRCRVVHHDYPRFDKSNIRGIRTNWIWLLNRTFGLYGNTGKETAELSRCFQQYPCDQSEYWRNFANSQSADDISPKWHYGEGAWATFEGLKVRIPENYDAYLTQKYGDWRADLPKEEQVGHHFYEVMDLNHPYTDYIERISKVKIRIKKRKNQ